MKFGLFKPLAIGGLIFPLALFAEPQDPRKVPVGSRLKTSTGHFFTLVSRSDKGAEAWKDEASGVTWSDKLSKRIRRKDAASLCSKSFPGENVFDGKHLSELPALDDFRTAETHGFREVLPNMKDGYFWIRSTVPNAPNIGHVFSGNLGREILIVYRSINFEHVRCISRAP